jgi:hypothetical protein
MYFSWRTLMISILMLLYISKLPLVLYSMSCGHIPGWRKRIQDSVASCNKVIA